MAFGSLERLSFWLSLEHWHIKSQFALAGVFGKPRPRQWMHFLAVSTAHQMVVNALRDLRQPGSIDLASRAPGNRRTAGGITMERLSASIDVTASITIGNEKKYRQHLRSLMDRLDESGVEDPTMEFKLNAQGHRGNERTLRFRSSSRRLPVKKLHDLFNEFSTKAALAKCNLSCVYRYDAKSRERLISDLEFRPNIQNQAERKVRQLLLNDEKLEDVFKKDVDLARQAVADGLIPIDILEDVIDLFSR